MTYRPAPPGYITSHELADRMLLHTNTIRAACKAGKLHAIRTPRTWIIPELDAELFRQAYSTARGEPLMPYLEPSVPKARPKKPGGIQTFNVTLPNDLIEAIDGERRRRQTSRQRLTGRSNVIADALRVYLKGD